MRFQQSFLQNRFHLIKIKAPLSVIGTSKKGREHHHA
jgi:hypothetical protein